MRDLIFNDVESLRAHLGGFGDDVVFRGQTRHHMAADGLPSITTSFHRHGCVPPLMLKWNFYADEILRVLSVEPAVQQPLPLSHAVLQHYGWRSFFIDVTNRATVAAWFASHRFHVARELEMSETCDERFFFFAHQVASYAPHDADGHLYVISKTLAVAVGASVINLEEELSCEGTTPRFLRQAAALLGNVERVPPGIILEHITAPAAVLDAVADGLNAEYLFPGPEEDLFLKLLLAVPWEEKSQNPPIAVRGLNLPEYHVTRRRFQPPTVTVYRQRWLAAGPNTPFPNATVFEVGDATFFGRPTPLTLRVPRVARLVQQFAMIVIETEGVLRHPELHDTSDCAKGLVLCRVEQDVVEVSEFEVRHPGSIIERIRALRPWSYRMTEGGDWTKIAGPDDCPCNNHGRHERHTWSVIIFEDLLARDRFRPLRENVFREVGVGSLD